MENSYRMRSSNGMFNGLTSGFINQGKAGETHFIFHSCAELLIFVPVLKQQQKLTSKS